jgi:hypothetical protein
LPRQRPRWVEPRIEPHDGISQHSKDSDFFEQPIHQHFEHVHRLLEQIQVRDDGAAAESMLADLYLDFLRDLLQLRQRGKGREIREVQQDVKAVDGRPHTRQLSEVLEHFIDRHMSDAPGCDERSDGVDVVRNGHDGGLSNEHTPLARRSGWNFEALVM